MVNIYIKIFCVIVVGTVLISFYFLNQRNVGSTTINSPKINLIIPSEKISETIETSQGVILINATSPEISESIPLLNGTLYPGDSLSLYLQPFVAERNNVTSDIEAPQVAKTVMEQYGGLPEDAVLNFNETNYISEYNYQNVVSKIPVMTSVSYSREINDTPVVGHGDYIRIDFGDNNEVIDLEKSWRTLAYTGQNANIITPEQAIEKLQHGDIINDVTYSDVKINNILFAYYENSDTDPEIMLNPVWVFAGITSSGSPVVFYISAQDFTSPYSINNATNTNYSHIQNNSDNIPLRGG